VAKEPILDLSLVDFDHLVADIEEIRRYNPQRFEFEQLTAIVHQDLVNHICVGYKDVRADEFWARGHMPGMPLMPGVLMCEAAAQICSYFSQKHDLLGARMVGFGGMEQVRFRDPVFPGSRLVIVSQMTKVRRGAMIVSDFQEFVGDRMVCEGKIKGIPLPVDQLGAAGQLSSRA
jgi:3-hydroxyacyl-[acyl-carrier-protein] dehydratase